MFAKLSNFIDRIAEWRLWRGIQKKLRPFVKVRKVVHPNEVPEYLRIIRNSLISGESAGVILLSDNKRVYNYIRRNLDDIDTVFFREPFTFNPEKLFDKIKENADVLNVDYSVTGYENDSPFHILAVPKDRNTVGKKLNQIRRDCHKKPCNRHIHTKH